MRGKTMECMRHYLDRLNWSDEASFQEEKKQLCKTIGAQHPTISAWLSGTSKPTGLVLVRLRFFLASMNYQVTELEILSKPVYELGKLIACGKINIEDATRKLVFAHQKDLFRVLHGIRGLSTLKREFAEQIISEQSGDLTQQTNRKEKSEQAVQTPVNTLGLTEEMGLDKLERLITSQIENLENGIANLEPTLKQMLSDKVTPQKRQAFREKTGRDKFFKLTLRVAEFKKLLNAMCSEESRKQYLQNNSQERSK